MCLTPITVSLPKGDFVLSPMPIVGDPSMFPSDGTDFLNLLENNVGMKQRYVDLTRVLPTTPMVPDYDVLMMLHARVSSAIELAKSEPPTVVLLRCTPSNASALKEMLRVQILMNQSMMCGWECVHALHIEPYCGVLFYGSDVHYILPQPRSDAVDPVQQIVDVAAQYMLGLPCVFCGEPLSNTMDQTGVPNAQLPCDGRMCHAHTLCAVASVSQTCPTHGTCMGFKYALTPQNNVIAASEEDAAYMEGFSWHSAAEFRGDSAYA